MHLPRPIVPLALAAALAVGPVACGGSSDSSSSGPTTTAASDAPATAGSSSSGKVSANEASTEEIAAALQAAGVDNADRWADEVTEYRPYPADDPDLTGLRDELEKYDPGQETIDRIVGALQP